jgi:hypothetical protein
MGTLRLPGGFANIYAEFVANAQRVLSDSKALEAAEVWSDLGTVNDVCDGVAVLVPESKRIN